MRKIPLWTLAIPIILTASTLQITSDLGEQGKLSPFLNETLYPIAQSVNGLMTNIKFRLRGPMTAPENIVIVEADDESVSLLGRWPWSRSVYGDIIHTIFKLGAKTLALDVSFSEPEKTIPDELLAMLKGRQDLFEKAKTLEGDPILAEVVRAYQKKLVLGYAADLFCQPRYSPPEECPIYDQEFNSSIDESISKFAYPERYDFPKAIMEHSPFQFMIRVFSNIPILMNSAIYSGSFHISPDSDSYIRRYALVSFANGKMYPSLGLKLAELARDDRMKFEFSSDGLISKAYFEKDPDNPVAVTPVGFMNLNFKGKSRSFRYLNVINLFRALESKDPSERNILKDAHVFFGVSAIGIYDMRAFPFDFNTPGVEGHATAAANLIERDEMRSASGIRMQWLPLASLITLGFLFAFAFSTLQAIPSLVLFLAFMGIFGWIDIHLLFSNHINLPTAFLILEILAIFGLILSVRYILEEKKKKFVRDAFSKYLAPQVVDLVLKDPSKLAVGGERKELTVLFSDLRGFTSFSENMDPKTLTQLLNEYLSEMTEIIFEHGGTLDKYIGDAIMAFWGAPLDQPDHVERAWTAAVAMTKRLREIAPDFKKRYGIDVSAGIGINSGVVSVGNMGSKRIFAYTVIGDHVNLASRLESLTRLYGCDILTTQECLDQIPAARRGSFQCRNLDSVKVKGKKNAVDLISVSDQPVLSQVVEKFEQGKASFRNRRWDEAAAFFREASLLEKEGRGAPDEPSEVYLVRCEEFKRNPPPAEWNGSIEMRSK
ncbi:MAG: adenylate/guanylate cyclase domain-containing protein [Bdellovibrionales bacterium]|nr:adenylate/guanylate cyclase domain-containing protein [Bdellovibrionales bacterium]